MTATNNPLDLTSSCTSRYRKAYRKYIYEILIVENKPLSRAGKVDPLDSL
jgi:hypothetical protein